LVSHALPQAPQLALSFSRSTHVPLQLVFPIGHTRLSGFAGSPSSVTGRSELQPETSMDVDIKTR
jgi:hypothetical protein